MLGTVFERFVEKSPISVMVRTTLEWVLGADRLDLWYECTAEKQYTREFLFSTIYDLMRQVVFWVSNTASATVVLHMTVESMGGSAHTQIGDSADVETAQSMYPSITPGHAKTEGESHGPR